MKLKEMFSIQQELIGHTGHLNADSFQNLKKLSLRCGILIHDDDLILVVDRVGKQLTSLVFHGYHLSDHVYSYLSNCER